MRIKKAVLLVLNNKTSGSILSTSRVRGTITPVKQRGSVLSDNEIIINPDRLFADTFTQTDSIVKVLIYNREFVDTFQDIDVVNVTFAKLNSDNVTSTEEPLVFAAGKSLIEDVLNSEQTQKTLSKVVGDIQITIERVSLTLTKSVSDLTLKSDVISKLFQKAAQDFVTDTDFVVLTSSKQFSDATETTDDTVKVTTKSLLEVQQAIENAIFNVSKILLDNNTTTEALVNSVEKVFNNNYEITDIPTLQTQKNLSELTIVSDLIIREIGKGIRDINSLIEETSFDVLKILADQNIPIDSPAKEVSKPFSDTLSTLDSIIARLLKTKDFFDNTTSQDDIIRAFTKGVQDLVNTNEVTSFNISANQLDTNSVSEQISAFFTKVLGTDVVVSEDSFEKTITKLLSDPLSSIDDKVLSTSKALLDNAFATTTTSLDFEKTLTDNVTITDVLNFILAKNRFLREEDFQDYTDTDTYFLEDYVRSGFPVRSSDLMIKSFEKGLQDSFTTIDQILFALSRVYLLSDSFNVLDSLSRSVSKGVGDFTSTEDALSRDAGKGLVDTPESIDTLGKSFDKILSDVATYTDNVTTFLFVGLLFTKTLSDFFQQSDNINISTDKGLVDTNQLANPGILLSQNYVENGTAGYDAEGYFAEIYVDNSLVYFAEDYVVEGYLQDITGNYFSEDYVGESRILT